ncbi:MAG: HdeD family acid-resistance protein [Vicinamibacterales bacterium]
MFTLFSRYWWVLVMRGIVAILFGVSAFAFPGATLAILVLFFGAYAFADGVFTTIHAIAGRKMTEDWWILLLQGVLGVLIGVLTLTHPAITAVALLVYIAVWAVAVGALQVIAAIRLRHDITGEWWLALGGILGIAFGVLLMWRPEVGALAVLWLIASYAIVWGTMLMIGGFDVRRLKRHATAA